MNDEVVVPVVRRATDPGKIHTAIFACVAMVLLRRKAPVGRDFGTTDLEDEKARDKRFVKTL
jgi:hypothetical protein